jgi:RNA polymerase sigma-70 factor (ECF subfamily)
MAQMSEGDRAAHIAKLWMESQTVVASFISSSIPDFHAAEDVLQQVAVAVAKDFETYDSERPFIAWAIGIAKFRILAYLRKRRNDRHVFDDRMVVHLADAFEKINLEVDPIRHALGECIQSVNGRSRQALQMRYVDDMKPAAIAEAFGIKPNAVSALLYRARAALGDCIRKRMAGEKVSHG